MEVIGLPETIAAIKATLKEKVEIAKQAANSAGWEYSRDVQKAIGRAGIRSRSGHYVAHIHVEPRGKGAYIDKAGNPYVLAGTNDPQAKRLEFGFFDMTDRLGRHFYQRARPHFRPTLDLNKAKYRAIMKGTFDKTVSYENWTSMMPGVY
jgi:hypothetical protein